MQYGLTHQPIQAQIAFVIQNKHGRHTAHRLDSTLPKKLQKTGPEIHFAQDTNVMGQLYWSFKSGQKVYHSSQSIRCGDELVLI